MSTLDGRYTLVFNGEIYNYLELRPDLEAAGWEFRGSSDTEVLLYALSHWGVEAVLPRLNGMFAFSLWDAQERELWLARDRFGEKPLYYAWHNGTLLFGSELKALVAHPSFRKEVDRESLAQFMRFNYVPWPLCIFKDAWKLGPGYYLRVKPGVPPGAPQPYWSFADMVTKRRVLDIDPRDPAIDDAVDQSLRRAVSMRMVADVPLGVFLSGGIDSSIVVAMMQAQSTRPVKTFTIGFWEAGYNEAEDAAKVARHLGTEHHDLYLSSRECIDTIARLPDIYDEPFADSSQIPTTLVSEFTRKHVTVALSGDGGDEIFAGYNRYTWSARIWSKLGKLPRVLRLRIASLIRSTSPAKWDQLFQIGNPWLPFRLRVRGGGEKLHKLATAMDAATPRDLYRGLVSQWHHPEEVLLDCRDTDFLQKYFDVLPKGLDSVEEMMLLDSVTYLPSDILCKVDRASMSCGLETRAPFLDNELADLAWRLPLPAKINGGVGKAPLRRVLQRYVPQELFERPKTGFGIPIGDWLRGPMRDWAEEMLSEQKLLDGGYFNPEVVRKQWSEHLSGRFNRQHSLWSVLMFQSWLTKYRL
jgi:asparagine synthase (glutamine-hydrolysing)